MAENPKINVVVKTSKNKETIQTDASATILEFKELVSSKFNAPVPQLCLIFAGRILKDAETLASYSIKDGLTVHLVIKSDNRAQQQAAQHATQQSTISSTQSLSAPPQSQPNPTPLGFGLGDIDSLGMLGGNSGNLHQMSQQLMSNPDMMRQFMDNPMVQSMMSNPDLIRQMIMGNPQMQQLIERNPEISHILNNPDLMRQTMEMMRNPSLMQEMMRTHDRALSNLESLPGGFNALQRMYTDIQEPMLNATQEQMRRAQNNPFAALFGGSTGSETSVTNSSESNPQQGTENTSPLPNPWSSSSPTAPSQPSTRSDSQPSTQPAQQQSTQSGGSTTSSTTSTTTTPSTGGNSGNPMNSMFQTPAMQNLMQQMSSNPGMFQNMMQSPYMQDMMQRMVQNPELMASIVRSNPMFQGNTQLADQMQNPAFQQAISNPRVMQAMMQIQQGMMQLQNEAPGLLPGMGPMGAVPSTVTTGSTTSTGNTTTTPTPPTGTPAQTGNPLGGSQNDQMTQLMTQMMQAMTQTQNPEVMYRTQLEQLSQMGFVDRARNIQALVATGGDLNAAIERLLQR
ncbi:ubiquilin-1-like isoform X1 [Acropora millepora]|uniref:ubiquilin-1-like isoform X1 n=1 Tax=Acropora millepora TaxID=45264 RepID=UPI001CF43E3E|nr:ubiquilin-1-like isoform X1 [Acropora millepora]